MLMMAKEGFKQVIKEIVRFKCGIMFKLKQLSNGTYIFCLFLSFKCFGGQTVSSEQNY